MRDNTVKNALSVSAQMPGQVPEGKDIGLSSTRLEGFLTRTFVPTLGLHVSLLGAIFLFNASQLEFDGLLWLFLFALCAISARTFLMGLSSDPIAASRQTTALFVLAFLTLMSSGIALPTEALPGLPFPTVLLAAGYAGVVAIAQKANVQSLSLVVIASYALLLAYSFSENLTFIPLAGLACWCTATGALCLIVRNERSYLIGFVVAGLIVVVLSVTQNALAASAAVLSGFAGLVVLAFVFYEVFTKTNAYSDLVRFIGQGVIVALMLFVSVTVFDDGPFLATSALFSLYTGVTWVVLGAHGRETRLLWCIITITMAGMEAATTTGTQQFVIAACGLVGMIVMSSLTDNRFSQIMAVLLSCVYTAALVSFVVEQTMSLDRRMMRVLEGTIDANPGTLISQAHSDFAVAVALLLVPILVANIAPVSKGMAWWRGLIRPRFVVVIRNLYRALAKRIQNAPLVGWMIGLVAAAWKAVSYLKTGGSIGLRDLLSVACFFVGAAFMQGWLDVWWTFDAALMDAQAGVDPDATTTDKATHDAMIVAWVVWGFGAATLSFVSRELLYRFVAFALFVTPSAIYGNTLLAKEIFEGDPQFLRMVVYSALAIYLASLIPLRAPPVDTLAGDDDPGAHDAPDTTAPL